MDLKIDPNTKELDGFQWVTGADEAKQRITLALSTNLGEFFTHVNYGLPWIENTDETIIENVRYFLGQDFPDTEAFITEELDRYLTSLPLVASLTSSYTFDQQSRKYQYNYSVVTQEGETINFPPYLQQL